jgi:hypothetical protein
MATRLERPRCPYKSVVINSAAEQGAGMIHGTPMVSPESASARARGLSGAFPMSAMSRSGSVAFCDA